MFGIICNDAVEFVGHSLFNNFRLALYNYFGKENFKDIKNPEDIINMSHLFIVDEHFSPHTTIWKNPILLKIINQQNTRVLIFNFEKIFNSAFPWNIEHQNALMQFKNYFQFVSDAQDAEILKVPIINKQYLSKSTIFNINKNIIKKDKVLFLGQSDGAQYANRRNVLEAFKLRNIEVDIVRSDRKLAYIEFLNKLNEYKFILNPLGTGLFINLRHFEALYCDSIPIQQITNDMISWNKEILENCISFITLEDMKEKMDNFKISETKTYLEDYFQSFNLNQYL